MKVAWHEVPGMLRKKRPVPQGRYDLLPAGRLTNIGLAMRYYLSSDGSRAYAENILSFRDGSVFPISPGTSCQATFI
jgi:hypothetical protein